MPLSASINALTMPGGTEFPGSAQLLLNLLVQYMQIVGLSGFSGINFGPTTPSSDDQDMPWFQTDGEGNPIGWFSWNGAAWVPIPFAAPNGPTSSRPSSPVDGMLYYDETIGCLILWERSAWRTADGVVGDVKFVDSPTIDDALAQNPGWIQHPDAPGYVLGAAGQGTGLTLRNDGDQVGEETHLLVTAEMPAHTHSYGEAGGTASATGNTGPGGILADANAGTTGTTGGGTAHNNMQPTIFFWCLIKQ